MAAAAAVAVTEAHAHPAVVSTRACKTREKWRKTAARPTPLTRTPPQPCCTGMHRLGMLLSLLCAAVLVGAARGDCEDTPNWKAVHPKGHEFTCFTYVETGWCKDLVVRRGAWWASGKKYNYPEVRTTGMAWTGSLVCGGLHVRAAV